MAFVIDDIAGAVSSVGNLLGKVADKIWPDPTERAKAQAAIMAAEQAGRLNEINAQLQAIIAEANSSDPWTSRARPTFLYVIYLCILLCIVGSVAGIWWPAHMQTAATNLQLLLGAIPEQLWWLFGAGYLGYTGARSVEKLKMGK